MTEQERFDRCLAEVLRLEGGYADDPRDPGGPTKFGVTRATLGEALGRPASAEEVRALSQAEAAAIYRRLYWAPMGGDALPAGLDLLAFDTAVNMGRSTAARLLQRALDLKADGVIGAETLGRARVGSATGTIRRLGALRRRRYAQLADFGVFGAGWLRRAEAVETLALSWAEPEPLAGARTA